MNEPLFSFCIPTRNRASLLAKAVESCLAQTYKNIEILIVDNASQDNTEQVAKRFFNQDRRIKYTRNLQKIYQWQNIFKVFSLAKGEYSQYLADDNFVLENYAEEKVRCFLENPQAGLVASVLKKYKVQDGKPKLLNSSQKTSKQIPSDSVFRNFDRDCGELGLICTFRTKDMQLAMEALKEIPNPYGYPFLTLNMSYDLLLFIHILARYPYLYFTDKTVYFDMVTPSDVPDPQLASLVEAYHLHKAATQYTFSACNLTQYFPFFRRYHGSNLIVEVARRIVLGPRSGLGLFLLPRYYADYHSGDWISVPMLIGSILLNRLTSRIKKK